MSFQNANVDEFGRDLSLRIKLKNQQAAIDFIAEISLTLEKQTQPQTAYDFMSDFSIKYAGMSWAEINYAIEEEEEEEERKKIEEQNKKLAEERMSMHIIGEYELEEGEVLE